MTEPVSSGPALELHHLETFGVAPVPDRNQCMRPDMRFVTWVLGPTLAMTPVIGLPFHGIGLWNFTLFVLSATLIYRTPAMLLSLRSRQVPAAIFMG
ncbi:MAG: hypothetical protein PHP24_00525 [Acidithiobacillus sp.]|nr:hypothetical protein [Acidithiobacillus sp.]